MSNRLRNINRDIIEWAIIRNGNDLEEFYSKNGDVLAWIEGTKYPTVKQLEKFTHKVHVPFGYMFLQEPPEEPLQIPFFRTNNVKATNKVSLNVYHTIQILKGRQEWLTEYLDELGFHELDFVAKYNKNDNYKDIVADIRNTLEVDMDWASKHNNWESALEHITNKIEEAGIIVTFNGIVGNNTHRPIDVEECRGLVLIDKKAPFLFVNSSDAKSAQMFTLVHELAHIWLGASAGFDLENMLPANDPIELICNNVAAELLVPEIYFLQKWSKVKDFKLLSIHFKVSPIVIARRALDLNQISFSKFIDFYDTYMSQFRKRKKEQESGGNFYATTRKRLSPRFAAFVNSAVKDNKLLYRDAYKLTNLKGETYNKFINEHLY